MFLLDDLLEFFFFFIIYHFKGGLSKPRQTTSYKLIPSKVAPWCIVIPFRVSVRLPQPKHWTGGFLLMCPTLVPDLPLLLQKKKIVGENHINISEGEVIILGNILKFFNKSVRISIPNIFSV